MLKKRTIKSRNVCRVTFEVPATELPQGTAVENVLLVGEFNGWDVGAAVPLVRNKKGVYRVTVDLEPGQEYQFRYLVNGEQWCNDWHADGYVANNLGTDNCIVSTIGDVEPGN